MILIIGLGNPGKKYCFTRHNLGFFVLDKLAQFYNIPLKKTTFGYRVARLNNENSDVFLLKTDVFMNISGEPISNFVKKYKIKTQNMLVVYDDFSLPLGKIRFREKGSSGGHKGIQSIIDYTGTSVFPRLKLGIGPVPENKDPKDFVLEEFDKSELGIVEKMTEEGLIYINKFIKERFQNVSD